MLNEVIIENMIKLKEIYEYDRVNIEKMGAL